MSYNASQFEDIAEALRRKNGKRIAKDQEELLDQAESWVWQLKRAPQGLANVPTHVLQTVTAAYTAAVTQTKSSAAAPAVSSQKEDLKIEDAADSSATPASSPEVVASDWSKSPESPRRRAFDQAPDSSLVQETPLPQQLFRNAPRKALQTFRMPEGPLMSSLDEEEDMEVQLPQADGDSAGEEEGREEEDSNQSSHPSTRLTQQADVGITNTPTCAQPDHETIPATTLAKTRGARDAKMRPFKRMKPISFGDSQEEPIESSVATRGGRMQSLKHLQISETQETLASSSVVPGTLTQTQTQHDSHSTEEQSAETVVQGSIETNASAEGEDEQVADEDASGPLGDFIARYPDYVESYNGTRLRFVQACLCLEYLRGQLALRDYLYDEFIRLFSHKYLDYVNDAGPAREPLSAIEWFNMQSGRPLYDEQVVSNKNIDQVLGHYKDDVALVRDLVAQHEGDDAGEAAPQELGTETVVEAGAAQSENTTKEARGGGDTTVVERKTQKQANMAKGDAMEVDEPPVAAPRVIETTSKRKEIPPPKAKIPTPHKAKAPTPSKPTVEKTAMPERLAKSTPIKEQPASVPRPAVPRTAAATPSSHAASPRVGSTSFSAAPPPSSMRSNAPVGTQYMQQLSSRASSSKTGEEAARERRERMRAAMRKRASNSARSSISKAGSVA